MPNPAYMKLGWNNPRPSGFTGPDAGSLKNQFDSLDKALSWPHVRQQVAPGAAIAFNLGGVATTTTTDTHNLVVGTRIYCPTEYSVYLAQMHIVIPMVVAGATITHVGFLLNGVQVDYLLSDNYWGGAVNPARNFFTAQFAISEGSYVEPAAGCNLGATTAASLGFVDIIFWPRH